MRKIFFYCFTVLLLSLNAISTSASFVATLPTEQPVTVVEPETGIAALTIDQILSLNPTTFQEVTGKKMSFKDRLGLKLVQRSIKKEIKKNGKVDVREYFENDMPRFNLGGFALGLLLGLIGVGLAHIFSNSRSFRRSSWYGLGILVIILLISAAASGN
jgi:hypothetical protein